MKSADAHTDPVRFFFSSGFGVHPGKRAYLTVLLFTLSRGANKWLVERKGPQFLTLLIIILDRRERQLDF